MPIALIAPYDKTGLREFAYGLAELGFDIYSTSGTQKFLGEAGLPVHSVATLTGFPEILDGRVKTLHPMVHGGILARRDKPEHMKELERSDIPAIDVVVNNLYPFRETIAKPDATLEDALENIDIGGPAMIRAAAKNHPSVLILVDPADYDEALDYLRAAADQDPRSRGFPASAEQRSSQGTGGSVGQGPSPGLALRRRLAAKAFQHVANYDTAIATYLRRDPVHPESFPGRIERFPQQLTVGLEKAADLRYGENPHLSAAAYRLDTPGAAAGLLAAEQLHGLDMSYLNYLDADAAWRAAVEFDEPAVVIVKHATPCGIATHADIAVAYQRAYDSDTISPFGGIIAAGGTVTWDMTEAMKGKRYDIIVAPAYEDAALERLKKRKDLRILRIADTQHPTPATSLDYRSILGGMLAQTPDTRRADELEIRVVTKRGPSAEEMEDLRFAWGCVKHVKSNAIVLAKDRATVGIGCGQPNRLWATQHALDHAGERASGAVVASDAFFPFARGDAVEAACKAGVTAIIQPGGGARDEEAIEVCNEYGVAMIFSGTRAFRH